MSQDQRVMTVLLIGESGGGKSAFGSACLQEPNIFRSAAIGTGVTEVTCCETRKVNGIFRCVIDSPGFSDSEHRDAAHIENMVQFLRGYNSGILVIAFVVQATHYRVSPALQKVIQQLKIMFNNPEIWYHFCIVVTHYHPEIDRSEKENFFRPTLMSVIKTVEGLPLTDLQIPVFFVNSLQFQNNASTQQEILRLYDFAASMQKPLSTNGLKIPDEVFAKIETHSEIRKVNQQPTYIQYQDQETYTEQELYTKTIPYTEQEAYSALENYIEQVPHTEKYTTGMWWWEEDHHYTAYTLVMRTRTVTKYRPVQKTRVEQHYKPVQKTRSVTKHRPGSREFWEEREITKKTFYDGNTSESMRTIRSWTNDV